MEETLNKNQSKYKNTALLMDDALLILLEKKDYEYITVKEVCQRAGVNRSTFYLHYEGMDDLLKETLETISKRFYSSFKQNGTDKFNPKTATKEESFLVTPQYLTPYLNFLNENARIFRLTVKKSELFGAKEFFDNMYNQIFAPILDKFGVKEEDKPFIFNYYSHGVIGIIAKWVETNCQRSTEDIMNIIITCLDVNPSEK